MHKLMNRFCHTRASVVVSSLHSVKKKKNASPGCRMLDAGCWMLDATFRTAAYDIRCSVPSAGMNPTLTCTTAQVLSKNDNEIAHHPSQYTEQPHLCRGGCGSRERVVPPHHSALCRSLQRHSVRCLGNSAVLASIILFCMTSRFALCRIDRYK